VRCGSDAACRYPVYWIEVKSRASGVAAVSQQSRSFGWASQAGLIEVEKDGNNVAVKYRGVWRSAYIRRFSHAGLPVGSLCGPQAAGHRVRPVSLELRVAHSAHRAQLDGALGV
jgi:hypothetical protein